MGVSFIREWFFENGVVVLMLFSLAAFSMMLVLLARVSGVGFLEFGSEPIVGDEVLIDVVADEVDVTVIGVEVIGVEEDSVPIDVSAELLAIKAGVD